MRPRFVCLITGASRRESGAIEGVSELNWVGTTGQEPSEAVPPGNDEDEELPQQEGGKEYFESGCPDHLQRA